MIIKYMTFSFAYTSWAGQAAVDGYCKFWVKVDCAWSKTTETNGTHSKKGWAGR